MKNIFPIFAFFLFCACGSSVGSGGWAMIPIAIQADTQNKREAIAVYNEKFGAEIFQASESEQAVKIELKNIEGITTGRTLLYREDGFIVSGAIEIDESFSEEGIQYFGILLHELGHLLGFEGHEENNDVLMFKSVSCETKEKCVDLFENDQLLHDVIVELYF